MQQAQQHRRRLERIRRDLAAPAPTVPAAPAAAAPAAAAGPLDGIVVIDAGQAITGPLACSMLGDMGASVIKVENPHGIGDLNRPVGPSRNGEGIYFHNFNRGKQGIVLDTKLPSAQAALKRMAATADVFIQNARPGAFERMGLSYEDLKVHAETLTCPQFLAPSFRWYEKRNLIKTHSGQTQCKLHKTNGVSRHSGCESGPYLRLD
jgi:hypothetical protein